MIFPFVSRDRYQEQARELERVRAELTQAHVDLKKLHNWIVWRVGGGVAPDASLLPEAYQPKPSPKKEKDGEETEEVLRGARRAPGQARRELGQFEAERQQKFETLMGLSRPQKEAQKQTGERLLAIVEESEVG